MTAAEWMFSIIEETLTFTIGTEFFDAFGVGYLYLLYKGSITLSCLTHNHFELRHWVWVIEEAAVCMRAHYASAKKICTISAEVVRMLIGCTNYCARLFNGMATVFTNHSSSSLRLLKKV